MERLKENGVQSIWVPSEELWQVRITAGTALVQSRLSLQTLNTKSTRAHAAAHCRNPGTYWYTDKKFSWNDDLIQWKHFPRYWPFVRGIYRSPVNSPHKGQWRGALMFSFICTWKKPLSKQSWSWWFETPSCILWRHCNEIQYHHSILDIVLNIFTIAIANTTWINFKFNMRKFNSCG